MSCNWTEDHDLAMQKNGGARAHVYAREGTREGEGRLQVRVVIEGAWCGEEGRGEEEGRNCLARIFRLFEMQLLGALKRGLVSDVRQRDWNDGNTLNGGR